MIYLSVILKLKELYAASKPVGAQRPEGVIIAAPMLEGGGGPHERSYPGNCLIMVYVVLCVIAVVHVIVVLCMLMLFVLCYCSSNPGNLYS